MHTTKSWRVLVLAVAIGWAGVLPSDAGVITDYGSRTSFGWWAVGAGHDTTNPNNDNAAPSENRLSHIWNVVLLGPFDAEWVVGNSGGTTEYFTTASLTNDTGFAWSGLRFELGFGLGASFVRSGGFDFLDFDTPNRDPAPTSTVFTAVDATDSNLLAWSSGVVGIGQSVTFTFSIDVPDNLSTFNPAGESRFTLRSAPVAAVPEPASLTLLGTALAGLGTSRRLRRALKKR